MDAFLDRYTDLWAWVFRPFWRFVRFIRTHYNAVEIWLLGDIWRIAQIAAAAAFAGLYVAVFAFAAPTSLYLLFVSFGAVLLRGFAQRLAERSIASGFFTELAAMAGWASVALLVLTGVQLWLNSGAGVSAAQFAAWEGQVIDATVELRTLVSSQNVLLALGGFLLLALVFGSLRPLIAFGAARQFFAAILAVLVAMAQFSFIAAADTASRRERITQDIVPRLVSNTRQTALLRKEVAAMRWAASEFATRPIAVRTQMAREYAALIDRLDRLCVAARAEFLSEVEARVETGPMQPVVLQAATTEAGAYCEPSSLFAHAVRPALNISESAIEPKLSDADDVLQWTDDVPPPGRKQQLLDILVDGYTAPPEFPIQQLRTMDANAAFAMAEARNARDVVRSTLADALTDLLGPEYRGLSGKVLTALQDSIVGSFTARAETALVRYWTASAPPPIATPIETPIETPKFVTDEPHLMPLSEAHGLPMGNGPSQIADDVSASVWKTFRPTPTAAEAATLALAGAATRLGMVRGVGAPDIPHGKAPRVRIPRFRF